LPTITKGRAVGPEPHRQDKAVRFAVIGTKAVELVLAGGGAAAEAEQPVGERLAVVRERA
jgi:hypothetical protein